MKRLLIFLLAFFPLVASGQKTFDLDLPHNRSTTYTLDTLFFDHDSTYITNGGDTIKFVVDDVEAMRLINEGTNSAVNVYGDLSVSGVADIDSAVSIGAWGYDGEHIVFSEASSNTNPLLGIFGEANSDVSSGKTIAGTYSRALVSANQTNSLQ